MKVGPVIGMHNIETIIQNGLLSQSYWLDQLVEISTTFTLITDHRVKDLVGLSLKEKLEKKGLRIHLFSVEPGEKSKTRENKERLEDKMLNEGLGRDSAIIALGGGFVSDLAGFVAATYLRGIPFIVIPTTLLAQIDASLGGKVGINTPFGKNVIGAFYPPRLVLIDPEMLTTLPSKELVNGMAEMMKYALIGSMDLFLKLEKKIPSSECIEECCALKKEIVEKDPCESGLRRILNFGHTVGHAIETCLDYHISHGEAVTLGLLAESHLSYNLGHLQKEKWLRIEHLIDTTFSSPRMPSHIDENNLMEVMTRDKKALAAQPHFVLLEDIGRVLSCSGAYCCLVDPTIVQETLRWLRSR